MLFIQAISSFDTHLKAFKKTIYKKSDVTAQSVILKAFMEMLYLTNTVFTEKVDKNTLIQGKIPLIKKDIPMFRIL